MTAHKSKGLDAFNSQEFDAAVTMECGDESLLVLTKRHLHRCEQFLHPRLDHVPDFPKMLGRHLAGVGDFPFKPPG
jgi:hypothetical protein